MIDYSAALHQRAGIGRYTRSLVGALLTQDRRNRYTLLHAWAGKGGGAGVGDLPSHARLLEMPISPRWYALLWYRWRLPLPLRGLAGRWDIFHSPDFALPRLEGGRRIVTVHDLSFLRTPHFAEPALRRYLARTVPRAVREADRVLADSEATRRDLMDLLGVSADKVQVIHAACEGSIARVEDTALGESVRRRWDLPHRYILSLGTLEPRKNFEGLIRAYGRLVAERPGLPQHLVIVGHKGWLCDGIFQAREESGLEARIHIRSGVPDPDLPAIYSMADLFAFPSWYEGFGMPPLEAMACGVPVVASDRGSLPEVLGEAACYVAPDDAEGIAGAMARLLEDAEAREALVQKGYRQAARFSWAQSARGLLSVYEDLGRSV